MQSLHDMYRLVTTFDYMSYRLQCTAVYDPIERAISYG